MDSVFDLFNIVTSFFRGPTYISNNACNYFISYTCFLNRSMLPFISRSYVDHFLLLVDYTLFFDPIQTLDLSGGKILQQCLSILLFPMYFSFTSTALYC